MPGFTQEDVERVRLQLEPLRESLSERGLDVRFDRSLVQYLAHELSQPSFGETELRNWIRVRIEELFEKRNAGKEVTQTHPVSWAAEPTAFVVAYIDGEVRIEPSYCRAERAGSSGAEVL